MKTQLPSAIILCALLLVLSLHAFAAGNQTTHVSSSGTSHGASNASALLANALGTRYTGYTITIQPTAAGEAAPTAALLSDASSRTCSAGTMAVEGETYLAAAPVLRALYPGLAVTEQADTLSARGNDLHLEALAGEAYFTVNDRCFYVPRFVQAAEGQVYLPLDTFAEGGKTFLNFFKKGLDFWQKPAIISIVACPARATQKQNSTTKRRANTEKSRSLVERARLEIV